MDLPQIKKKTDALGFAVCPKVGVAAVVGTSDVDFDGVIGSDPVVVGEKTFQFKFLYLSFHI